MNENPLPTDQPKQVDSATQPAESPDTTSPVNASSDNSMASSEPTNEVPPYSRPQVINPSSPVQPDVRSSDTVAQTDSGSSAGTQSEKQAPQPVAPVTSPIVGVSASSASSAQMSTKKPKRSFLKPALIGLAGLVLLGGVSAAAYFGYVLPNKPENRILKGFLQLAESNELKTNGKVDFENKKSDSFKTVSVDFEMKTNAEKKHFSIQGDVGVAGTSFPYDVRFLDSDVYFKVGGLDNADKLLNAGGASQKETMEPLMAMVKQVNNQWFMVDRSLTNDAPGTKCFADASGHEFTDKDVNLILNTFQKHPLFAVKSQAPAEVDGQATTKFELDLADDKTAKQFADGLKDLSIIKKLDECLGTTDEKSETTYDEEVDKATEKATNSTLTVYLTGDNDIKQIDVTGDDDEIGVKVELKFNKETIDVPKPENAKPFQELIMMLMGGSQGFGGDTLGANTDVTGTPSLLQLLPSIR